MNGFMPSCIPVIRIEGEGKGIDGEEEESTRRRGIDGEGEESMVRETN